MIQLYELRFIKQTLLCICIVLYIDLIIRFKHLFNISAKGEMKKVSLPQRADFSSLCLKERDGGLQDLLKLTKLSRWNCSMQMSVT